MVETYITEAIEDPMISEQHLTERYADLPNGRYRYLEWGDRSRDTIVLLHGRTGCAETWLTVGGLLSRDHHVIAFEQRGHGGSPWSAAGAYNLADFLEDYEHFVERVVRGPHLLVGHSMGACTTLVYTARHPDLVTAAVLEDGGPPGPTVKRMVEEHALSFPASFASWSDARAEVGRASPHLAPAELDARTDVTMQPGADGRYYWRADLEGLLGAGHRRGDRLFDEGQWDAVAQLAVPLLVLRADRPPCLLDGSVVERMRAVSGFVSVVHKPTSHEMHEEIPEEFVAAVRAHEDAAMRDWPSVRR